MHKKNEFGDDFITNEKHEINKKLDQYKKEFDIYKPNFKGRHENDFPPKWYDYVLQTLVCLPIFVVCGLLMWGLLAWGFAHSRSFGWVSFGIFIGYLVVLNLLVFFFGGGNRKRERECIAAKFLENTEKTKRKREEAELNAQMLRQYQMGTADYKMTEEEVQFKA